MLLLYPGITLEGDAWKIRSARSPNARGACGAKSRGTRTTKNAQAEANNGKLPSTTVSQKPGKTLMNV
jgi:hypothetical protein